MIVDKSVDAFKLKLLRFLIYFKLGDSRNYRPPILVPFSAKRIATEILVISKLNGSKDFILRVSDRDITRARKK